MIDSTVFVFEVKEIRSSRQVQVLGIEVDLYRNGAREIIGPYGRILRYIRTGRLDYASHIAFQQLFALKEEVLPRKSDEKNILSDILDRVRGIQLERRKEGIMHVE
jgi:hypothetical protein